MAQPHPGVYKIKNVGSLKYITITGGPGNELSSWDDRAGQEWQLAHLGNLQYILISNRMGLIISAINEQNQLATAQYQEPTDPTGRWTFDHSENGSYKIRNVGNIKLVLDLSRALTQNGNQILAYVQNNTHPHNQDWILEVA